MGLQKRKYILAVGRFVPEKEFDFLMDAFQEANKLAERSTHVKMQDKDKANVNNTIELKKC